ncbi:MAG TPA: hypothetical protein VFJ43_06035, partial [Bacteroidia bacterium]|nr:hypothetical protein [Bacteroidia bacterium]
MKKLLIRNIVHRTPYIVNSFASKRMFLIAAFLFPTIFLKAQIPIYGADSLMKHYVFKMNHFIDRDTVLGDFYSIDLYGISVFAGPDQKKLNQAEYHVNWSELPLYKNIIATAPREEAMQIMLDKGNRPFP